MSLSLSGGLTLALALNFRIVFDLTRIFLVSLSHQCFRHWQELAMLWGVLVGSLSLYPALFETSAF